MDDDYGMEYTYDNADVCAIDYAEDSACMIVLVNVLTIVDSHITSVLFAVVLIMIVTAVFMIVLILHVSQ